EDVRNLLGVLQRLVDGGNTVVVIEHHIDVMLNADHIIDLGPLGGERGGRLVAEGTPEEVARHPTSLTARYLRQALAKRGVFIEPAPPVEERSPNGAKPKTRRQAVVEA